MIVIFAKIAFYGVKDKVTYIYIICFDRTITNFTNKNEIDFLLHSYGMSNYKIECNYLFSLTHYVRLKKF